MPYKVREISAGALFRAFEALGYVGILRNNSCKVQLAMAFAVREANDLKIENEAGVNNAITTMLSHVSTVLRTAAQSRRPSQRHVSSMGTRTWFLS